MTKYLFILFDFKNVFCYIKKVPLGKIFSQTTAEMKNDRTLYFI